MARYTLKAFYGSEQIERFESRPLEKLYEILEHPRYYKAGDTGPFGEVVKNPDKFEISNTASGIKFRGNISELLNYMSSLK